MSDDKDLKTEEKKKEFTADEEVTEAQNSQEEEIQGDRDDTGVDVTVEKEAQAEEVEQTAEEVLMQKVSELEDKLLRNAAEFENYKKRTARQFDEIVSSANDRILLQFLEVVDNFNRSFEHDDKDSNFEAFKEGVKLIYNQMIGLLDKYDIKPIEAVGKEFDPNLHEAMMQVESDEFKEGTVAMEIAKGYRMGDRILRHSKVGVAKKNEDANGQENEN